MGAIKKNSRSTRCTAPETCPSGSRQVRAFRLLLQRQVVRPRRGRFPVIGSSPHWPGGTGISNLRPLAGWISALERGRFQGHKQKRKLKSVAPFARNRKFESISLQRRVRLYPASAFEGREPRLSARVCAAGLATGSAETRRVFRYRASRRQYLCRAIFQYRGAADGVGENAALHPTKLGLHWAYISCAVDLSVRMKLRQSRARSADRARQAADGSARGASPP